MTYDLPFAIGDTLILREPWGEESLCRAEEISLSLCPDGSLFAVYGVRDLKTGLLRRSLATRGRLRPAEKN